jgi:hypothetical protein
MPLTNAAPWAGTQTPTTLPQQAVTARRPWSAEEDAYLRAAWGSHLPSEIAAHLGRSISAVRERRKRLRIRDHSPGFTLPTLQRLTGIDRRQLGALIERGWLRVHRRPRQNAAAIVHIPPAAFAALLRTHPEVYDYAHAAHATRVALGLHDLPPPPRFKQIICRSNARNSRRMGTCAQSGGTAFFAALYDRAPHCPRCGCKTTHLSETGVFTNEDLTERACIDAVAGKLGLRWDGACLRSKTGEPVVDADLLRYVFDMRQAPHRAVRSFRRLLKKGLRLPPTKPLHKAQLLADPFGISLRKDQAKAFEALVRTGSALVCSPPALGKSTLALYAMGRIGGRNVLFVPTATVAEVWLAALRAFAPQLHVRRRWKPHAHVQVIVYDRSGREHLQIDIYNYRTTQRFEDVHYRLAVFDECHFLPGNRAHTLLFRLAADHRLALTASPWREDGREDIISVLSPNRVGENWDAYRARRLIPDVRVRVIVVDAVEQKFALLPKLARQGRTLIYVEKVADGERVSRLLGVPFISGASRNRLQTIAENRIVAISRVGDCGASIKDVRHVIEVSFLYGARAQSIQRHGRLFHSADAVAHTVLMTREELARHFKRLSALEQRGCSIAIERATPDPAAVQAMPRAVAHATWCDMLRCAGAARPANLHGTAAAVSWFGHRTDSSDRSRTR